MNLALVLSQQCNLRCSYCFEGEKSDPKVLERDAAIRLLEEVPDHTVVEFYGGEPLLQIPLIEQIIDWAQKNDKSFHYAITTNGQVLPDHHFIDHYLQDFAWIRLSIDGPEDVHDRNRGKGSYRKVITFLERIEDFDHGRIMLNATFTRHNLPHLVRIAQWFLETMHKYQLPSHTFHLNMGDYLEWTDDDFSLYAVQLRKLLIWWSTLDEENQRRFMIACLENAQIQIDPFGFYFQVCSANIENFALSPHGTIFPCVTEVFMEPSIQIEPLRHFSDRSQYRSMTMQKDFPGCFACERYECGPCPAVFRKVTGSFTCIPENHCRLGKLNIKIVNEFIGKEE